MFPEITVTELSEKLKSEDKFILLDVRELHRVELCQINGQQAGGHAHEPVGDRRARMRYPNPRSRRTAEIYVMCHHGNRSMQVTAWLAQQGWKNVFNVRGGIDAYARRVDKSVGFY